MKGRYNHTLFMFSVLDQLLEAWPTPNMQSCMIQLGCDKAWVTLSVNKTSELFDLIV